MSQPIFILTLLKIWWGKKEKHSVCVCRSSWSSSPSLLLSTIFCLPRPFLYLFHAHTQTIITAIHFPPKTTINIRTSTLGFFGGVREMYILSRSLQKKIRTIFY